MPFQFHSSTVPQFHSSFRLTIHDSRYFQDREEKSFVQAMFMTGWTFRDEHPKMRIRRVQSTMTSTYFGHPESGSKWEIEKGVIVFYDKEKSK